MLNSRFFALIALIALLVMSACTSNKQVELEPEPVRDPLALAREAAQDGAANYEDGMLEMAIISFESAIELFTEAAPLAAPSDSIDYNIEIMKLNIAKSHVDMAFESIEMSMFSNAIEHYEAALDIYQSHEPVRISQEELDEYVAGTLNNLAIASKNAGNHEAALGYYDQMLAKDPDNAELLNAKFFILKDDLKDSVRAFQTLEDYAEVANDATAYIMLADNYAQAGDTAKAEEAYLKAELIRPDADIFTRIGNFYRANGNYENANIYLQKLIVTQPDDDKLAVAYNQIAQNYNQMGNRASMVEYLEKSLEVKSDARIALTLAGHYNSAKNWSKVIQYATITLREDANNSDARMLRGVAYYQQKNNSAAIADLERLTSDPKYGAQVQSILKAIK
jgi:tetratricopeptide (TPR) repeat protein